MSRNEASGLRLSMLAGVVSIISVATPAVARPAASGGPDTGAMTLTGSFDVASTYMFRGIRQNSTGVALWPVADLGVAIHTSDGAVKHVGLDVGSWNSLNTGDTGAGSATGKLWYESDFYTALRLAFGGGVSFTTTYTAYTSPNNSFSTVKEIMFKLAIDDAHRGRGAVRPYALVARELGTAPGLGQADGGAKAGTYLEVGVAPGYAGSRASIAVPMRIGLSLGDYYELERVDHRFGFFSLAGVVTVPLKSTTRFGTWNIHGGAEVQRLGETTAFLDGDRRTQIIGSLGMGLSYQ